MFFVKYGRPTVGQCVLSCHSSLGSASILEPGSRGNTLDIAGGRAHSSESQQWHLKVMFSSSGTQSWVCLVNQFLII